MSWIQSLLYGCRAVLGRPVTRLAYARVLAESGEHHRAFHQFTRAAESGLPAAQFWLGRSYLLGLGAPSCPDAALRWLTRAAKRGDVEAQTLLASLALQGISVGTQGGLLEAAARYAGRPPDYQEALKWGRRAAIGGSAEAQAMLGYILTSGPEELRDMPGAAEYYRQAAESGFARGQLGWALALLRDGGAQSSDPLRGPVQTGASDNEISQHTAFLGGTAEVRRLLESAAEADLPAAHFMLGVLAEQGGADPDQLAIAAAHFRKAAEQGHRSAQLRYGVALLNGSGVKRDTLNGETWLRRAGIAGDANAAALVGDLYARPGELPPNFCEAATWFQRAAEAGHTGAARALGQLCLRGGGFGSDPMAAAHWLRVAATAGDMLAAYELGICLSHGIGTGRDDTEAVAWFRRAIDAIPAARYWYARMLSEARGTVQDLTAARALYLQAAAEGIGDAAVAAGELLVNGRGGPPDRPAAMALFRDAAARGHRGAQYALTVLEPADDIEPSNDQSGGARLAA